MQTQDPAAFLVDEFPAARRSMRVAVVTETYPPEVNGVAMSLARVVEGLQRRGHHVQLVRPRQAPHDTASDSQQFHEVLFRGLPIPRYPHLRLGVPSKRNLVRLWSMQRPDVVHVATEGPLGWSAVQAARHLRLPASSDFRTNFHAYSRHYGVGWLHRPILAYLRKFHNRTAFTTVPTEALRQDLAASGFERLEVVGRGVDACRFDPARRSAALRDAWGAAGETTVALYVGRLAAEKNLETLAAAYTAMRAVDPQTRLVVVGDGPQREELRALVPEAVFAGQRAGDDLASHYASADVFLFPSLTETFGNVTTEAMASGLAVVAFAYAAAAELIDDGTNGSLVPFGDRAEFVRRAAQLAGRAASVRELGGEARATALTRDLSGIVHRIEALMINIAATPAPPTQLQPEADAAPVG